MSMLDSETSQNQVRLGNQVRKKSSERQKFDQTAETIEVSQYHLCCCVCNKTAFLMCECKLLKKNNFCGNLFIKEHVRKCLEMQLIILYKQLQLRGPYVNMRPEFVDSLAHFQRTAFYAKVRRYHMVIFRSSRVRIEFSCTEVRP